MQPRTIVMNSGKITASSTALAPRRRCDGAPPGPCETRMINLLTSPHEPPPLPRRHRGAPALHRPHPAETAAHRPGPGPGTGAHREDIGRPLGRVGRPAPNGPPIEGPCHTTTHDPCHTTTHDLRLVPLHGWTLATQRLMMHQ